MAAQATSLGVRVTAAATLLELGDVRAVPLLVGIVADAGRTRHSGSAVQWALDKLTEFDAFETIPALEEILPQLGLRERWRTRRAVKTLRRTHGARSESADDPTDV